MEKRTCFDEGTLDTLQPGPQQRTRIKEACAIAAYRERTIIPVIKTLVCDDAPQFKLLTQQIALCWIHDGRHYKKLRPIVPQHKTAVDEFLTQYWFFYHQLKAYKKTPDDQQAAILSQAFDTLFSTKTGYAQLDERIAKTRAKRDALLVVLDYPELPLHNNRINTHDLLTFTNRGTAGKDYKAICKAVTRLGGVQVSTNIKSGDEEQFDVFGLIDSASIRRKHGLNGRLLWCDVTLSDWVFNAIKANEVLTLHRDYFRLRKPLERRIYELARKHCGQQPRWKISLELLLKKSGSQSSMRKFRQMLKHVVLHDHLPDYRVTYDVETDRVTFTNRNTMPLEKDKTWDGHLSTRVMERVSKLDLSRLCLH